MTAAVLQNHAVPKADALANRDAGVQHAVLADLDLPPDHDVGVDDGAGADPRAVADHRKRPDETPAPRLTSSPTAAVG